MDEAKEIADLMARVQKLRGRFAAGRASVPARYAPMYGQMLGLAAMALDLARYLIVGDEDEETET